jgi:hypothetical protein
LQRGSVVGHDAADLKTAVFFVKDIHQWWEGKFGWNYNSLHN